jgi:hypothetical protein
MPDIQSIAAAPRSAFTRSPESLAFEKLWRDLPRKGLVPDRAEFKPERAKHLLRNLILVAAPKDDADALSIRLVGSAIHEQIGRDVTGLDYAYFLDQEQRASAHLVVGKMFARPCGFWQIAPVHYERGYSQFWEMTGLPLAGNEKSPPLVLAYVRQAERMLQAEQTGDRAMYVGPADPFEYIDIGAGVPALG